MADWLQCIPPIAASHNVDKPVGAAADQQSTVGAKRRGHGSVQLVCYAVIDCSANLCTGPSVPKPRPLISTTGNEPAPIGTKRSVVYRMPKLDRRDNCFARLTFPYTDRSIPTGREHLPMGAKIGRGNHIFVKPHLDQFWCLPQHRGNASAPNRSLG